MANLIASDVAKYFLAQMSDDCGDTISNLKLQKLLYYAQGFHLALFVARLCPEASEAWAHGPVVADVYHQYKEYGSIPIPPEEVEQYMQKVMTQMKRHQVVDPDTGRVDLRYNPASIEEDYYIPVRGGAPRRDHPRQAGARSSR